MKKLPKSEARLLQGKAAEEQAALWLAEAGEKLDAEERERNALVARGMAIAAVEAAKQSELEAQINARMGICVENGALIPADKATRQVVDSGAVQKFGVRGDR